MNRQSQSQSMIVMSIATSARACARREKAELKRTQLQERIAAGEQVRERMPTVAVPDDEDVEWQQLVAANRDAGC